MDLKAHNDSFDVYKLSYKSRNFLNYQTIIHGLLLTPKDSQDRKDSAKVPGIVLLPGGGITKEGELNHAIIMCKMGYAVLVIDQRGLGETGGYYLSFEDDYKVVQQGKEPVQHLSVYDALAGFDVLRSLKEVDGNNVAMAGLSMGGRYAIIAAALDKRIKGVVTISAAGFHIPTGPGDKFRDFMVSCDLDHYIGAISPRPVFMAHGSDDKKVALADAQQTFQLAKEPKGFFIAEGCGHGYCDAMHQFLNQSLRTIFQS
jgi:fermentation-respiration switch protein FrsA (DUF1100 family)